MLKLAVEKLAAVWEDSDMRDSITCLGALTPDEISEISTFLHVDCQVLGQWAKYVRADSSFNFAICSNGQHFIRLSGYDTKGLRFYKTKEVATPINEYGYVRVSGFSTMHQLVAEAFIPNFVPYPEKEINHIDGNKLNNDVSNLELVSHKQNMVHFWSEDCMREHRDVWVSKHVGRHWSESQRIKFMSREHPKYWSDKSRLEMSQRHKGKKLSLEHAAKLKQANRGTHRLLGRINVTDGISNHLIKPDDLAMWEARGYHRGKTINNPPKQKKPYVHTAEFLEKQQLRKLSKEAI